MLVNIELRPYRILIFHCIIIILPLYRHKFDYILYSHKMDYNGRGPLWKSHYNLHVVRGFPRLPRLMTFFDRVNFSAPRRRPSTILHGKETWKTWPQANCETCMWIPSGPPESSSAWRENLQETPILDAKPLSTMVFSRFSLQPITWYK